jgi:hypothetical protein
VNRLGFNNHTAHNLLNAKTRSLRLDHIEIICLLLKCTPNDILGWKPHKNIVSTDKLPLSKLQVIESKTFDIKTTLMDLTLDELKFLTDKINKDYNENNTEPIV